jgi:hypothetical protein
MAEDLATRPAHAHSAGGTGRAVREREPAHLHAVYTDAVRGSQGKRSDLLDLRWRDYHANELLRAGVQRPLHSVRAQLDRLLQSITSGMSTRRQMYPDVKDSAEQARLAEEVQRTFPGAADGNVAASAAGRDSPCSSDHELTDSDCDTSDWEHSPEGKKSHFRLLDLIHVDN